MFDSSFMPGFLVLLTISLAPVLKARLERWVVSAQGCRKEVKKVRWRNHEFRADFTHGCSHTLNRNYITAQKLESVGKDSTVFVPMQWNTRRPEVNVLETSLTQPPRPRDRRKLSAGSWHTDQGDGKSQVGVLCIDNILVSLCKSVNFR